MSPNISERRFEEAVEYALLAGGEDAAPTPTTDAVGRMREPEKGPTYSRDWAPGGYRKRRPEDYDRALCLVPRDTTDFIYATQPKEWEKYQQHYGAEAKEKFLKRLAHELGERGALDVLRKGIKDAGCKFQALYFKPVSRLNADLQTLYQANVFSVIRQVRYSDRHEKSLDMVLFLNGIPIMTIELKNPMTSQTVDDAIRQYREDRDPRDTLLAFRRCLAHFAVDPDLVYVTTQLAERKTRFVPFNQGRDGGAGNPPVPPTRTGYATSYLWEDVLARDSLLDLIQHFIHEGEEEDEYGERTGRKKVIFPRYHQLDAVRRLVHDARLQGTGGRHLIQHSAGSGKSNSIAWLAHRFSALHDDDDRRVFDSVVVISDRRVIDKQLQRIVRAFEQTQGLVENIEHSGRELQEALEAGKTIIVTTLQKFPVIANKIEDIPGRRFAIIIDEAHSSQSGETSKSVKTALTAGTLESAEAEESGEPEDQEDRIVAEMRKRQFLRNASYFAFTATPKAKTLELFGLRTGDGRFQAFSLYPMRQAIEEKFILDVLQHYTTYKAYWRLLKKVENDPRYDRGKANAVLRAFVDLHEHAIRTKVEIMVEHFHSHVAGRIGGRAKAMIVTRSRLSAVRYRLAVDEYLREKGYPYRALVAFTGKVTDGGKEYTEPGMNGMSDTKTAATFRGPEFRFLIVAEKFQTGFDEPLLHTMYVDKKLGGVNAVQTLSRLNRMRADKEETMVLDFANEADEIRKAFEPYYGQTILSEATDPNRLYDLERQLKAFQVFGEEDVEAFAGIFFRPGAPHDQLHAALTPSLGRFNGLAEEEQEGFRGALADYVRLYAFLSQILTFVDADLERLYVFSRILLKRLPARRGELPREIQQYVDMDSYRVQQLSQGKIPLRRGAQEIPPIGAEGGHAATLEDVESLSQIIKELNKRFGTSFTEDDVVSIRELEERLIEDEALAASVRVNVAENARLTFDHVVNDRLQDMLNTNFKLFKQINDDPEFAKFFKDLLFERVRKSLK